jgi:hypothetical protein
VFDTHLDGFHSVPFFVHGPERAFVVPHGNWDALSDVVGLCCKSWNGAGSLILDCDSSGRLRGAWKQLVKSRPLDQVVLHPSLPAEHQARIRRQHPDLDAFEWRDDLLRSVHPATLVDRPAHQSQRYAMTAPVFATSRLQRIAQVCWGMPDFSSEWLSAFDVGRVSGDLAYTALLGGQLGVSMVSPLVVTQVSMRVFGQWGPKLWPSLWIFRTGSFDELLRFWNFRASVEADNRMASVVGLPAQALHHPDQLEALKVWVHAMTGPERYPTFLANVAERDVDRLEALLSKLGVERGNEPVLSTATRAAARGPSWLPLAQKPADQFIRGAHDDGRLQAHAGRGEVDLPRPRGYRPTGGAWIVMQGVPSPLPVTKTAARAMMHGAYDHPEGLAINMGTSSPWRLHVELLDSARAMEIWASDHGYAAAEPRVAADARAVLQRLGDLLRLEALADPLRVGVLSELAPLSRPRLVDRLARRFAVRGRSGDLAAHLAQALRDDGLLLDIDSQTSSQLASKLQCKEPQIIAALAPLVETGFVHRGRNLECPRCRFVSFVALRELDEHVRCRACGVEHMVPVTDRDGREARMSYRVDGLMARIMDQHVLPVLLALRALRDPSRWTRPSYIWPGMLFTGPDGKKFDVDLLASDGQTVYAAECKLDARGLGTSQLRTLLAFTDRVGAVPIVAALAGTFPNAIRQAIERREGLVLERNDLLTIGDATRSEMSR